MWGNLLQTFGCLLQLLKLIKYNKNISEGDPCKISVVIFGCIALGGQERLIFSGLCDKIIFEGKALNHWNFITRGGLLQAKAIH